jgi:ketosteroid isomerase-like protein
MFNHTPFNMIAVQRLFLILLFLPLALAGCTDPADLEKTRNELLEIDATFSRASVEEGASKAFLAYISEDCVLLRPNKQPIKGREKIIEMFSKKDDHFTLSWTPLFADISKSGDLGYTYGTYKTEMLSPEGGLVTTEGTYVSIWKKDANGQWKFVLDTGNQGLGKKAAGGE